MKAVTRERYGPPEVLRIEEIEQPTPKDNEVLIEVHAASLNAFDWRLMRADPFLVRLMGVGLLHPNERRMGADMAGRVETAGAKVTRFKPGDEVYGDLAGSGLGAFGEYVCAPETVIALKPAAVSFAEAAAVPMAGLTALQGLRDAGRVRPGQSVLIHGASGGVGSFAVQIARALGAKVTAVCSTRNLEMAKALGAEEVIDYTREDVTTSERRFDLILGVNGYHSISDYKRVLKPGGLYAMAGGSMKQIMEALLLGPVHSMAGSKKVRTVSCRPNCEDLMVMNELVDAGKVKPVIDREFPLDQIVDAIRYVEKEHARGKVVVRVREG